jgi:inhibitor of cysteine peptidase
MPDSISISEKDNNRQVKVSRGTILVISLNENPTTGFNWRMQPCPEHILILEADDFSPGAGSGVGGGGTRRFQFRAIGAGRAAIRAKYRRTWDPENKFASEFTPDVLVE